VKSPYRTPAPKEETITIKQHVWDVIKKSISDFHQSNLGIALEIIFGFIAILVVCGALIVRCDAGQMNQPCSEYANWRASHIPVRCLKEYKINAVISDDDK
jgi:hypothetical protein